MRTSLWLMTRFRVSESLLGDIVEEYSRARSTAWLWHQVAVAIVATVVIDIRAHKWLVARALVLGWLLGQSVAAIRRVVIPLMAGNWVGVSGRWLSNTFDLALPVPFLIVMSLGAVMTGWFLARLHRGHEMSMVLAYVCALLLFYAGGFLNSLGRGLQMFGGVDGLIVNSLFPFIVTPALVIIGGLLAGTRQPQRRQPVA